MRGVAQGCGVERKREGKTQRHNQLSHIPSANGDLVGTTKENHNRETLGHFYIQKAFFDVFTFKVGQNFLANSNLRRVLFLS